MSDYLAPFAFALFMWWFSTGLVLLLNHLPRRTYRWSMLVASAVTAACLLGIHNGSSDTSPAAAWLAFSQALVIWAWLEMSYFMGMLTGPRKAPCPPHVRGWARFRLALQTSLYHELAVVLLGVLIIYLTWDAANRVALGTFVTLWLMRWSAKLNLFFGVANVNADWLPQQLRFLTSYMGRGPMNLFFPLSVTLASALATLLLGAAVAADEAFLRTGYMLVGSLLLLAVVEHWFLVLPLHDSALWDWALKLARIRSDKQTDAHHTTGSKRVLWRRRTDGASV